MAEVPEESAPTADIVKTLVANHREFLAFVQKRVGNAALAEEILQDAFVRSLDKLDSVRDTAVGWFYRVLRNAIIDHQRRTGATRRLRARPRPSSTKSSTAWSASASRSSPIR